MYRCLRLFAATAILSSAAASSALAQAGAAPPVHLDVATQALTAQAPLFIAQDMGYFTQQGLEVGFQFIGGGTINLQFLATRQADIATGSPGPALWNAVTRGIPVKITAASSSLSPDPATGFSSALWLALPTRPSDTGPIKSYADLKGKRIGVLGLALGSEIVVDAALQLGGLTLHDVDLRELRGPEVLVAFANGAVDAATEIEPFVTQGVSKGLLTPWKNAAEITPGRVAAVMMFGPRLIERGGDIGARFMTAWTQAARDYNDAFGPKHAGEDRVIQILAAHTEVKDPDLYRKMTWHYINPNCSVSADALKLDLDWDVKHGYVEQAPDLDAVIDERYCSAARATLGPYQPR
ncbi:MAG TPA: ABC transporter substrate-binding protein [Stellaceae bacterium]|jgi:NitT/TauT family transport system substrate-binding protein|nr:ABC transporter substrate-binding protein [Stellaceae bacterium]